MLRMDNYQGWLMTAIGTAAVAIAADEGVILILTATSFIESFISFSRRSDG